ncbi:MAG: rod shape-determining protein MreD [Chitinophagales bacterium]
MRFLLLILIPYLSIFLETTLFSRFTLRGIVPDLVLIFVTFYSIWNGPKAGFAYGFLTGLLEDLYMGRLIGMNALAKGFTAYLVGFLGESVFKENILVGFGGTVAATVLNAIFMFFLALVSTPDIVINKSVMINMIGEIVYNGLLSIPFYVWYYKTANSGFLGNPEYRE